MASVLAGRREVPVSSPEKVLFAAAGVTKLELARYYAEVAEVMLPHVRDRPLALQSHPGGVGRKGFYLKAAPSHTPAWITQVHVPKREGGALEQLVARDPGTLVWLAGQNVVALHVWTARVDRLERPDRLVIDLDPAEGQPFAEVRAAARAAGELLRSIGLTPWAMTTGSRGLHVAAAVQRRSSYADVHAFAAAVAERLAAEHPAMLTTSFRKAGRGERLYLDVARNGYGQHAIAAWSPRALPDAPVATPLHWDELGEAALDPQGWTVRTVLDRLRELGGDPWAGLAASARGLAAPRAALARLG